MPIVSHRAFCPKIVEHAEYICPDVDPVSTFLRDVASADGLVDFANCVYQYEAQLGDNIIYVRTMCDTTDLDTPQVLSS